MYPFSDFNTVQHRQADVEHDHIRSQRFSLTNGIHAVRSFADDQQIRPLLQQLTQHAAEPLVILDDENSKAGRQRQATALTANVSVVIMPTPCRRLPTPTLESVR